MKEYERLLRFHDRLLVAAGDIKFDKRNMVDVHRLALYGSILELSRGICVLLDSDARIGIPSLFRSLLEATVELVNLLQDAEYLDNMEASHKEEWIKVLKQAALGTNPFLASFAALPDLDLKIQTESAELQALKDKGRPPLSIFDRFRRAGMEDEYRSLYNFLSCDSHSNIRALISRHISMGPEDFQVCFYKDEPVESFAATLDSTSGLVLHASKKLYEQYPGADMDQVDSMLSELAGALAELP